MIEEKDLKRIQDIQNKSGSDTTKAWHYADTMANTIDDKDKAFRRYLAAQQVFGNDSKVRLPFLYRAKELGHIEAIGEVARLRRLVEDKKIAEGIEAERQLKAAEAARPKLGPGSRRANPFQTTRQPYKCGKTYQGTPILPTGALNLRTGKYRYGNVREEDKEYGEVIEIWQDDHTGAYRAIRTSGKTPVFQIGTRNGFIHDQNWRFLFEGKLVDYIEGMDCAELIPLYGPNMSVYCYK